MAVKIKSASAIAEKWSRVTPGRAAEYRTAIEETAPGDWEGPTRASEPVWAQAVQAAAAQKLFGKGVAGAGEKWKRKATELGANRYGPGVAAAGPDFAAGFAPYRAGSAGVTPPPKDPRGTLPTMSACGPSAMLCTASGSAGRRGGM